jgi:hypothetical protein
MISNPDSSIQSRKVLQNCVGGVQLEDFFGHFVIPAEIFVDALHLRVQATFRVHQPGHGLRQALAGAHVGNALTQDLLEAFDQRLEIVLRDFFRFGLFLSLFG